jgi:hypothetical protein
MTNRHYLYEIKYLTPYVKDNTVKFVRYTETLLLTPKQANDIETTFLLNKNDKECPVVIFKKINISEHISALGNYTVKERIKNIGYMCQCVDCLNKKNIISES